MAAGQEHLGYASLGKGVHQDYAEAASWYREAADAGRAAARGRLGSDVRLLVKAWPRTTPKP